MCRVIRGKKQTERAEKQKVLDALSIGSFLLEKLIASYPFRDLDVQHEEVHMFLSFVERQRLGNHCDQHGCAGNTLKPHPIHTQEKDKTQKTLLQKNIKKQTHELCDHVSVDKQFHTKKTKKDTGPVYDKNTTVSWSSEETGLISGAWSCSSPRRLT